MRRAHLAQNEFNCTITNLKEKQELAAYAVASKNEKYKMNEGHLKITYLREKQKTTAAYTPTAATQIQIQK